MSDVADGQDRKRILYYCQSLVGVGHLTAGLQIIRALLEHADIDLIHGGLDGGDVPAHAGFRKLHLPSILIDSESGALHDPTHVQTLDQLWQTRAEHTANFLRWPYHAIVVEFFPFGRRRFKNEILTLIRDVHEHCGPVPVFCNVREVLVPEDAESQLRIVRLVKQHIHTVFVRGDPDVIRLDATFAHAHLIADQLEYTGYLCAPRVPDQRARSKQIVVSQGGGNVGRELLEAAISAAPLLRDFRFLIAAGSGTPEAEMAALRQCVRADNVDIVHFLRNFPQHVADSALSISMGGDNTMLDVISTRTPALAFPYPGNTEQSVRIECLARKGLVHALTIEDLSATRLSARIDEALRAPYPTIAIAMNGARNMSQRIKNIMAREDPVRVV